MATPVRLSASIVKYDYFTTPTDNPFEFVVHCAWKKVSCTAGLSVRDPRRRQRAVSDTAISKTNPKIDR